MIILASASPRRRELLKLITEDFEIHPSSIIEDIPKNISTLDVAEYLATQKAMDVSKKYPNDIVIGSDTIIVNNNKIYGKPLNKEHAKTMLQEFSNNTHACCCKSICLC